ncbi:hypothetical protein NK718_07880 [Alsobacter sp. SYSU M60028]|uniref:Uncharacterized protein n=1 Tax=Alsobacter ponti TaxID=2962936 RepID=A0ABT1LAA3_9HYPH|nr:hypothetical protein [Alsobacter ponti]MCP8938432.1 hypothetical protein [Alsobacter ponti]
MTVSFLLIFACLVGGFFSRRLNVFAIALVAPALGVMAYMITGDAITGVTTFAAIQFGYAVPIATAAFSRRVKGEDRRDPVIRRSDEVVERAKEPAEGL